MKKMGLKCKIQKQFVITTDSNHKEWIPDNILDRNFNPDMPNVAVVGDITYIKVESKWIYLSVFIDLFSRKVVGWDLNQSLSADSTCNAFKKYLYRNNNPKGYWFIAIRESNMHQSSSDLCWDQWMPFKA